MSTSVFWFRKDLRISDHPALNMALETSNQVFLVATADQLGAIFETLGDKRKISLISSWKKLNQSVQGKLLILASPTELVDYAKAVGAETVFVSEVFDTNGVKELNAVGKDLAAAKITLRQGPGNYAVKPGTVTKTDGSSYRVYTPFFNEWVKINPGSPVKTGALGKAASPRPYKSGFELDLSSEETVPAGEELALITLHRFLDTRVENYADDRNRADLGGTSHLSHALSHGEIHPRTILALLPSGNGADVFRKEIAWREFYADVLFQRPDTLTEYLNPQFSNMQYNEPGEHFEAWKAGKTGYPMVDAGMRQLLETGWMHNRVRMIVASFLVKDLHIEWQHGALWFEEHLTDFDPASNSHGWQWTAGCGTDASPYYRIFNPVGQGLKFDPNGDYVRKFVPELRHIDGSEVHEPWNHPAAYNFGYPSQIIDHATERLDALARLELIKKSQ